MKDQELSFPQFKKIYCEICGSCNLHCSFCPISEKPRGMMSLEFFQKIIAQIQGRCEILHFHLLGEPLLHPDLAIFLEETSRYQQKVSLVTNGMLLKKENIFLHQALTEISISLQSFEGNFQDPIAYNLYLNRILFFVQWFRKAGGTARINLRLWNLPWEKLDSWQDIPVIKKIIEFFDSDLSQAKYKKTVFPQAIKLSQSTFIVFAPIFKWPDLNASFYRTEGYCLGLDRQIGILADGTVVPCCLDHAGTIALGNLHLQTFDEILNGERAKRMISELKAGRFSEELCRHCEFATRFRK